MIRFLTILLAPAMVYSKSMERLDRGLVVVPLSQHRCYLGWRLLESDPKEIAFNLYRSAEGQPWIKLNQQPVLSSTNLIDSTVSLATKNRWQIRPVIKNHEQEPCMDNSLPAGAELKNYIDIPLQGPYGANKIGIGDLDGDGTYDYVIKQPRGSIDPGRQRHSPDTYKIEAYNGKSGKFMWRYDLGWNINMGIWFSPALVYDLDGDGKAEVALKTAPFAATMKESFESDKGFVLEGPETCSILDGETGQEITRVDWIERGDPKSWGDDKGNRVNRNQIGVAYLDGQTPSLLVMRGTYTKMFITAYRYKGRELEQVWSWSGENELPPLRGQGGHSLHAFDIDEDGRDELIIGSAAID
jgi:rhamnogalacturonan endolyase